MKSFVVIGLGRFGTSMAKHLYELGHEVLAVDKNSELVQNIANDVTHAVTADCTDPLVLKSLGVRNFDMSIVAIGGDIQDSILTTLTLKESGVKYVVAKAQSDMHAKVLKKIGADKVVFPERDMGVRLANSLSSSSILDYIEISADYSIAEVVAPAAWVGKSFRELNIRAVYGLNVMAVKNNTEINVTPNADYVIADGDILVVIGSAEDIENLN